MRIIWNEGVSVFYAGWRGGRRCRDVAMVDKIEVTLHVSINGIFPQLAPMTYLKLSPMSLILVTYSQDATDVIYFSEDQPQKRLKVSRRKVTTYRDPDLKASLLTILSIHRKNQT